MLYVWFCRCEDLCWSGFFCEVIKCSGLSRKTWEKKNLKHLDIFSHHFNSWYLCYFWVFVVNYYYFFAKNQDPGQILSMMCVSMYEQCFSFENTKHLDLKCNLRVFLLINKLLSRVWSKRYLVRRLQLENSLVICYLAACCPARLFAVNWCYIDGTK